MVWIFVRSLCVICYNRWLKTEGDKNYWSKIGFSWIHSLPFCFEPILNLINYDQLNSSLKCSFTNIRGFHHHDATSHLALCETNLDHAIDSGNFTGMSYLQGFYYSMYDLAVYVRERLPFVQDLPLQNSMDSYLHFRLALLHSVSYFFFLYRWSS